MSSKRVWQTAHQAATYHRLAPSILCSLLMSIMNWLICAWACAGWLVMNWARLFVSMAE
jgi:hypothetical protein